MTLVRLEPAAPRSPVKHSTTQVSYLYDIGKQCGPMSDALTIWHLIRVLTIFFQEFDLKWDGNGNS